MRKRLLAVLVGLLVSAGALVLTAAPASAAACAIKRFGYTGYEICGTSHDDVTWSSGQKETLVIGTDNAIWHIKDNGRGWTSVGGNAKSFVRGFVDTRGYHTVQSVGTDNRWYCLSWLDDHWGSWHVCDVKGIATNRLGGHCADFSPCHPGLWCADFARWVWRNADMKVSGITAEAGSFYTYGANQGTLHTGSGYKPRVGDAIVFDYSGGGNARHVGLVIEVGSYGVTVEIGGNQGNTVGRRTANGSGLRVGSVMGGQRISAFVSPVHN